MPLNNTTTIFDVIRHGEPDGGQKYRGHRDDPLSDLGWQQMRAAVNANESWDLIISSPLLRCREFSQQFAAQKNIPFSVAEEFKEIHFGEWEGLTRDEVTEKYGDHQERFWRDAENHPPAGAETIQHFHQRIGEAWEHWRDHIAGKKVLLVCHGGVIRMLLSHVLSLSPSNAMAGFHVPYACRSRIRIDHTPHGVLSCLVGHGNTVTE